ncbi:MAG: hypothetical protein UZ18_ATM001002410 [Armatimonadetes bacterium OLB18]|nr:MAG: hypothetical protein UZ18_ATM001002410 [Armatimonadetes bacterium OLB18]
MLSSPSIAALAGYRSTSFRALAAGRAGLDGAERKRREAHGELLKGINRCWLVLDLRSRAPRLSLRLDGLRRVLCHVRLGGGFGRNVRLLSPPRSARGSGRVACFGGRPRSQADRPLRRRRAALRPGLHRRPCALRPRVEAFGAGLLWLSELASTGEAGSADESAGASVMSSDCFFSSHVRLFFGRGDSNRHGVGCGLRRDRAIETGLCRLGLHFDALGEFGWVS